MARRHGRCPRGDRLGMVILRGHRRTSTPVGAVTLRGMVAPVVFSGAITRDALEADVQPVLVPELRRGCVVATDNLSSP